MAAKRGPIASAGSDREALEALRDRLAIEIDRTISVPYLVRLSSQFITAVAALKKLEPVRVSRRVDEMRSAVRVGKRLLGMRVPRIANGPGP
jgi:hypothetical protein